jgi:hypothetical protein
LSVPTRTTNTATTQHQYSTHKQKTTCNPVHVKLVDPILLIVKVAPMNQYGMVTDRYDPAIKSFEGVNLIICVVFYPVSEVVPL